MKWITATFPELHIHGVAKFEDGVFRSTDPQVIARMAPWVGRYGVTQVSEDTDPPDLPLRDPWPGAVLDIELFGEDGKVRESVLPPRLSDVELRAASVAALEDAADVAPTGAWDFATAPTVGGAPLAGAVASVNGQTGAVTLTKSSVGLGSVDNTADSAKPVSTAQQAALDAAKAALPYLNAADYGFLTGNTAAANNTAFANAVTAARAAGRPLYIPGRGLGTPYLVSAPLDLSGGLLKVFGDPGQTQINNASNTSALILCGGSAGHIADISIKHTTLDTNTGNGIEVNNVDSWKFERVAVYACGWAFKQTGGFFFSNYLEGMNLKRFFDGGIYLTGGTGSQWNNTYINNYDGTAGAVCTDSIVRLEILDESVFNQLNIEWCVPGAQALLVNNCPTMKVNGLHIEKVNMTIFDQQMIRAYFGSKVIIDSMTMKFCDIAPAGSQGGGRTLVGSGAGGQIDVRGLHASNNSNTAGQVAKLAATDSDVNARIRIATYTNDVFTAASTGAGLREIGDPIFPTKAGALTTTELPYSGMAGFDTTNGRLYWNSAGAMKFVAGT